MALEGKKIAFLVAQEGIEQVELTEPWKAVERGRRARRACSSPRSRQVQAFNHLDKADTFDVDRGRRTPASSDYDGLVLPGGVANPDSCAWTRTPSASCRAFLEPASRWPSICHAPVDARRGRTSSAAGRLTSWPSLQTDIRNAGAEWVDEEVVVDGSLVTSRKPDDLPASPRPCRRV